VEQRFFVAQQQLVRIFSVEPVDQVHVGTDLSTPSPLESWNDGIEFPFEVVFGELREEVEGSAL